MAMAGIFTRVVMVLTVNSGAVCFNAYHALAVEGAPGPLTFLASNGEITATDDGGILTGSASAFHLLGIPRVELQGTDGAIKLSELHRDDAATSVEDEALDKGSLVGSDEGAHEKKKREALASEKRLRRFRLSALRLPMKEQYLGISPRQRQLHTL